MLAYGGAFRPRPVICERRSDMANVRRDVWKLPPDDKTLEWYGKAVGVLQSRPISDVTSWWSLAAMHGIDLQIWQGFRFINNATRLPPPNIQRTLWRQCQHLTWYFLPWHRGYLVAFERIVRDAVVKLGGPADWALPYWNYSDSAEARELPRAFAKATLPDGSRNFLHVRQRYGAAQVPNVQNPIVLDPRVVAVNTTLRERFFEGTSGGGSAGFGGIKTAFWHGDESNDATFGVLETQPHGGIHVWVGGGFKGGDLSNNPLDLGLMTNPDTAALDPIFWLHHANIDRLWNVWLKQQRRPSDPPDAFKNPTNPDWLDGPRNRDFSMPNLDGSLYKFVARNVLDTTVPALDYVYDDDAPPAPLESVAARLESLGASRALAAELEGGLTMTPPKPAELMGANLEAVQLGHDVVQTQVRLDSGQRRELTATLESVGGAAPMKKEPDRVYLNLENIRSPSDAAIFYVYVNLPKDADPEQYPDHFAGTLSMFGVSKASAKQDKAGNGITASFDITPIIDKLHMEQSLGDALSVTLKSAVPGAENSGASIGRISVYRQGQ
jgi:tyrosinase